jgi:molybdopterin synthase catalytic subunit
LIEITERAIVVEPIVNSVRQDEDGAVVSFVGVVRSPSRGKTVLHIEYEAFTELALKRLEMLAAEIEQKWGLRHLAIIHRVGKILTGETAVVIAVGAPHRAEAFAACEYAIDRLKATVPVWKKEVYTDGESWITDKP